NTLVAFAVMGGLFGEGIDLVGEMLSGAAIIGPGLPMVCPERELIKKYFDDNDMNGFDYSYTYPGMNRVLQAAGRVIRSETDTGFVLLIDSRFGTSKYKSLFPKWWNYSNI
ncbi:MAG TPA: helicase C-terminal domain-containing protein, partial [Clostridia bacterium]|nr:helicase C-terminal domain-containing protein [Clostridia bacterium]